jgi:hypothetical protein
VVLEISVWSKDHHVRHRWQRRARTRVVPEPWEDDGAWQAGEEIPRKRWETDLPGLCRKAVEHCACRLEQFLRIAAGR